MLYISGRHITVTWTGLGEGAEGGGETWHAEEPTPSMNIGDKVHR